MSAYRNVDNMPKFYAVRKGKSCGIFHSWDEVKSLVIGYPGAEHKSFDTIAKCYDYLNNMSLNKEKEDNHEGKEEIHTKDEQSDQDKSMIIYTDGCHYKHAFPTYLGIGGYCQYSGQEYHLSKRIDGKMLESYGIKEMEGISNPTAEFIAFAETIKILSTIKGINAIKIIFRLDYIGVEKWMNGEWKITKPYIQCVKDFCSDKIKEFKLNVRYEHVNGHSGIEGNEIADKMSKNQSEINTFDKIVLS